MINWINKRKKRKGFSLVELVVVIAILGVLAGIAVPRLNVSRKSAAIAAHNANVRTLMNAANMYIADNGVPTDEDVITWTKDDGEDDWGKYLQEWPTVPKGTFDGNDEAAYVVTIREGGEIEVNPPLESED